MPTNVVMEGRGLLASAWVTGVNRCVNNNAVSLVIYDQN